MKIDSSSAPAHRARVAALLCPNCNSGDVRRSRRRHDDAPMHKLFYRGYRCRGCRTRFWRLDIRTLTTTAAVALIVVAAVAAGLAFDGTFEHEADPPIAGSPAAETAAIGRAAEGPAGTEPSWSAVNSAATDPGLFALAEKGDARAQYHLAVTHLNGQGVPKNMALALKWFDMAAQQGHTDAQYAMGSMHLAGRGVRQNFQTAFKWFDMAAQQNHAESQYQIGLMYRNGGGVGIDKSRAYFWFNVAAAQGHARAAIERDRLVPTMSAEQVALAQRNAEAWRPLVVKP